jgi:hypothetical protein
MSPRDNNLDQEARGLWSALRSDPPPEGVSGAELLQRLIAQSPCPDYDRIASPFLRSSLISRPPARS